MDPTVLAEDVKSFNNLKALTAYVPADGVTTTAAVTAKNTAMTGAQAAENVAHSAWETARDRQADRFIGTALICAANMNRKQNARTVIAVRAVL